MYSNKPQNPYIYTNVIFIIFDIETRTSATNCTTAQLLCRQTNCNERTSKMKLMNFIFFNISSKMNKINCETKHIFCSVFALEERQREKLKSFFGLCFCCTGTVPGTALRGIIGSSRKKERSNKGTGKSSSVV